MPPALPAAATWKTRWWSISDRVLNPGGLRMDGEFARHKLLDAVGDLRWRDLAIAGRFVAHRSGHALNNALLRALLADRSAWEPFVAAVPVPVAA